MDQLVKERIGFDFFSKKFLTHFSIHCSSSFFGSLSSFGAARLARLCELTLPVSLQVLDAGDGGGGISKRSAVSLLLPLALDFATLLDAPLPEAANKI